MFTRPPLRLGETVWDWSRPYLLGIVNVTPDSFSDGAVVTTDTVLSHALALVSSGADALDIGGESTRPGATPVSLAEELDRVLPVLTALHRRVGVPLSIDTTKPAVASAALSAGATIVNDTGLGPSRDALAALAVQHDAAFIAMHARGTPTTMRELTQYTNVVTDVREALSATARQLITAGLTQEKIFLDPGIGFAKTASQSLALLANLDGLKSLGYALCVGASRKSYIVSSEAYPDWHTEVCAPLDRRGGTAAAVALAVSQGVELHRVHDVSLARQAARVAHAIALRRDG